MRVVVARTFFGRICQKYRGVTEGMPDSWNGRVWRVLGQGGNFRLATCVPSSYTHFFHAFGHATVAQWQSTGFVNQKLWVQLPPVASRGGSGSEGGGKIGFS